MVQCLHGGSNGVTLAVSTPPLPYMAGGKSSSSSSSSSPSSSSPSAISSTTTSRINMKNLSDYWRHLEVVSHQKNMLFQMLCHMCTRVLHCKCTCVHHVHVHVYTCACHFLPLSFPLPPLSLPPLPPSSLFQMQT